MKQFQSFLLRFDLVQRRQLIAWLFSAAIFVGIFVFARWTFSEDQGFLSYAFGLYLLDSFIFFALLRERPKMRLVMLTFIFLLEIAATGYYLFTFVSTG